MPDKHAIVIKRLESQRLVISVASGGRGTIACLSSVISHFEGVWQPWLLVPGFSLARHRAGGEHRLVDLDLFFNEIRRLVRKQME